MHIIKAAVCHRFGAPLTVEDVHLRPPEAGEVEVDLDAVAICHSDISFADGGWGGSLPAVYGHEAAGRVRGIGPGVTGLNEGDPVVVTLIRACGQCPSCGSGRPTGCETPYDGDHGPLTMPDGGKLHQAMACGAFAEKVVVHHSQVVKLPEGIDMAAASLLACGVITGVGAVVNAAHLRAGQDVVVIGAGGVGLNAIQGARIAGARRIVAVDMSEDKLATAREFGATDGVLATRDKPWRMAKRRRTSAEWSPFSVNRTAVSLPGRPGTCAAGRAWAHWHCRDGRRRGQRASGLRYLTARPSTRVTVQW